MQEEIEQLARDELVSLNDFLDNVLEIPRTTFRKYYAAAFMLEFIDREINGIYSDIAQDLIGIGADAQLEKLCEVAPNIPREAIRAFSIAYSIFDMVFIDKKFATHLYGIDAIEMFLVVRELKGFAIGIVAGTASSDSNAVKAARAIFAKSGAAVRHTENRAMKADVFKWLDDNFTNCKSMDSAAEAMTGKLVPATFRTVRDWVAEWKKLRSASTP